MKIFSEYKRKVAEIFVSIYAVTFVNFSYAYRSLQRLHHFRGQEKEKVEELNKIIETTFPTEDERKLF